MTDETAATFMPPLTRIHDACAAFVAAYRTDDEDGNQVRRALAELRTALLRHREPHETEPQWRIGIEVPMRLPDEQRHTLFAAVADAVHDWEPEQRDGWDVNVYGCPAAEDTPDHFHRAPDEDEATVDRVAEAAFGAWHEGCSLMPADPAGAHWRRIARAALRAARRTLVTAPDLSSRLLAAITEVEQREGIKVHLGLTEPSLLLSLCEAHREIVEQYTVTKKKLDSVTRRLVEHGPDARLQHFRALHGTELVVLRRTLESLARAYGLNPEEDV